MFRQVIGLTEKMRQRKAHIEGGIAKMNHFVVQQHEIVLVDENILWAVIAVH